MGIVTKQFSVLFGKQFKGFEVIKIMLSTLKFIQIWIACLIKKDVNPDQTAPSV